RPRCTRIAHPASGAPTARAPRTARRASPASRRHAPSSPSPTSTPSRRSRAVAWSLTPWFTTLTAVPASAAIGYPPTDNFEILPGRQRFMTAPTYEKLTAPTTGSRVTVDPRGKWNVPDDPIVCLLKGDGIGQDIGSVPGITTCAVRVLDAAVEKAYKGK